MKGFLAILMCCAIVSCDQVQTTPPKEHDVFQGKASYVIDGHTFYFSSERGKVKVHIYNIDGPGMNDKNGYESYEYLRKLIHEKTVNVEFIQFDDDQRWVANVTFPTGEDIGKNILESGYVHQIAH